MVEIRSPKATRPWQHVLEDVYKRQALWDTKVGDISVVKSTPAKRDLIAPFVKEVRKQGLKLGFYYSLLDLSLIHI